MFGEPYFSLGTEITPPNVQHQTSVNGQVLRPADTQSLEGTNYLHFAYPNEILRATANNTDLTTKFVSNDRVEITMPHSRLRPDFDLKDLRFYR
ncbi:hypothetical protein ACINNAV113_1236 [Acinetobacter baumannii Naval-113]|nr:hypothetical protein ACINNAV113_1236 [Acinetobacter baumannii Naval-113]